MASANHSCQTPEVDPGHQNILAEKFVDQIIGAVDLLGESHGSQKAHICRIVTATDHCPVILIENNIGRIIQETDLDLSILVGLNHQII